MSYSRWGSDSDLYLFAHSAGYVACMGCLLTETDDDLDAPVARLHTPEDVVAHLERHREAGHRFEDRLLDPAIYAKDGRGYDPFIPAAARRTQRAEAERTAQPG